MIQEKRTSGSRPEVLTGGSERTSTRNMRIFVPIDFSPSSFTALEYALNLAKVCGGSIDLFHLTDVSTLGESDNAVVINRMLDRLENKAAVQNESLREMIEESGVPVASCESIVGNAEVLLQKKIEELAPDLIVMNKTRFAGQGTASLITKIKSPLLVISDRQIARLPSNVVISVDRKPVARKTVESLFRIVQRTSSDLTLLNIGKAKTGRKAVESWNNGNHGLRLNHAFYNHDNVMNGIVSYVTANDIDLLCVVQRRRAWWKNLFSSSVPQSLIGKLDVTMLIVHD